MAAASSFRNLSRDPWLQKQVLDGLGSPMADPQRAAVRVSREHFLHDPKTPPAGQSAFAKLDSAGLRILMQEASDPQFLKKRFGVSGGAVAQDQDYLNGHPAALRAREPLEYPIVVDTVMASLLNPDANVSAAALDTLRKVKGVEKRPDFLAAMNQLQTSTNPRLKLIAASGLKGKNLEQAIPTANP